MKKLLLPFYLLLSCAPMLTAQLDTLLSDTVDELLITASRISTSVDKLPAASFTYEAAAQQQIMQQNSLQEFVRKTPGLFTLNANNYAQDLRISLRGFGSRASFGIRGIKLLVDGVPETTPDGQGQLDNLNLAIIEKIEVLNGPSSALYGNASGGIINITTTEKIDRNFTSLGFNFGSFGARQFQITQGLDGSKTDAIFHGTYATADGFRVQSGYQNLNLSAKVIHELSDKSRLRFNLTYLHSPQADDPGGINLESVEADRTQARDNNLLFKTGEEIDQFKSSLQFESSLNKNTDLTSYAFFSTRNFFGKLPFGFGGIIDLSRKYGGHGSALTFVSQTDSGVNKLQVGYDLAIQNDARLRFFNNEGEQGDLTFDQGESFFNAGLFVVDHYQLDRWYINAGLRWDINRLSATDMFLTNGDDSGSINLNAVNPSLGISYQLGRSNYIYANFSTSFETPTLNELSNNPEGNEGFNPDLQAQRSRNLELGVKGSMMNQNGRALQYSLAAFNIKTSNDLVPFELEAFPDRDFFRNAGETQRLGLEGNIAYSLDHAWTASLSYTYSDFTYLEYELPSGDFSDNVLPGIPNSFATLSLTRSAPECILYNFELIQVGELFANDRNDVTVPGYTLVNTSVGYQIATDKITVVPHFGINNLFATEYFDNIRINAFGGRYYEAAPQRNFYAGLKINF